MKILIAADHAGYEHRLALIDFLRSKKYDVEDMGAFSFDENNDYPVIMAPVGMRIAQDPEKVMAVVLGGSGNGEAIVVNRFPGVRAAVYYGGNLEIVRISREHNNANILSLGARFLSAEEVMQAVELWLSTKFSGDERHVRRIEQIDAIE